tara:strand:- start:788 stop:1075 length:288 start_codon:yes stop_codon:yes gene_type:complete
MRKIVTVLTLAATLVGCESLYDNGGIEDIRSQRQVDAYNLTVSSESEKLVCTRERPLGSNIPRFSCMTVAQRDRMAQESRDDLNILQRGGGGTTN